MSTRTRAPEDALISRRILILSNLLRRAAALRYRRLLDISVGEWGAIAELGVRASCALNELAGGLALDKTRLSRTVTGLVRRGLVQRRANPRDNRETLISLTSAGEHAYARILESAAASNAHLLEGFADRDRKAIVAGIDRLAERARELLGEEQVEGKDADAL